MTPTLGVSAQLLAATLSAAFETTLADTLADTVEDEIVNPGLERSRRSSELVEGARASKMDDDENLFSPSALGAAAATPLLEPPSPVSIASAAARASTATGIGVIDVEVAQLAVSDPFADTVPQTVRSAVVVPEAPAAVPPPPVTVPARQRCRRGGAPCVTHSPSCACCAILPSARAAASPSSAVAPAFVTAAPGTPVGSSLAPRNGNIALASMVAGVGAGPALVGEPDDVDVRLGRVEGASGAAQSGGVPAAFFQAPLHDREAPRVSCPFA